jgi:hypothetical protein
MIRYSNQIQTMEGLEGLANLETLWLNDNRNDFDLLMFDIYFNKERNSNSGTHGITRQA